MLPNRQEKGKGFEGLTFALTRGAARSSWNLDIGYRELQKRITESDWGWFN